MAKVYDVPRYKNQTAYKISSFLSCAAEADDDISKRVHDWFNKDVLELDDDYGMGISEADAAFLAALEIEMPLLNDETLEGELPSEIEILRQAYESGFRMHGNAGFMRVMCYGKVLARVISLTRKNRKTLLTDSKAIYHLVSRYISRIYTSTMGDKGQRIMRQAAAITRDYFKAVLSADNLGSVVAEVADTISALPGESNGHCAEYLAWCEAAEKLQLSSMTPEVRDSHRNVETTWNAPFRFRVNETYAGNHLGCKSLYRVGPFFILEYEDFVYVLDHSAVDQFRLCAKFWSGLAFYCKNYRACGNLRDQKDNTFFIFSEVVKWVTLAFGIIDDPEMIPRKMKTSVARLQLNFHKHAQKLHMGIQEKDVKLQEEEKIEGCVSWSDFLTRMKCSDRFKIDVSYAYHGFPAPDADLGVLYDKQVAALGNTNTANATWWRGFMAYCKSYDLCKVLSLSKEDPGYKEVFGYDAKSKDWWNACKRGQLTLPPESEMGNAWLFGHFSYSFDTSQWFWEASDVTYVHPDVNKYSSVMSTAQSDRCQHNELLYALKHAPNLADVLLPDKVNLMAKTKLRQCDSLAVMAAKSENTKKGKKVRTTWSADCVTRELTSQYDRAAVPLASMYRGVTARKSDQAVDAIFARIDDSIASGKLCVIISNDASSWSDLGDRNAWAEHHDYILRTTTADKDISLHNIWSGITAVMNKRGHVHKHPFTKGLFQGWTPTMDTLMNVRLSLYCVREAKRKGLLLKSEGAETAGLIDDAIQSIALDARCTKERAQKLADSHYASTFAAWKNAGATLDPVKTLYSNINYIYLNRFHCEGSEVINPAKVFAKSDRELTRRFSSIWEQLDSVLGSYRSAVSRGADPVVCFMFAIHRCISIVIQTSGRLGSSEISVMRWINFLSAPRSLGGAGMPTLCGFISNESQDRLVQYVTVMYSLVDVSQEDRVRSQIYSLCEMTLDQEMCDDMHKVLFTNPRNIVAKGVKDPKSKVQASLVRCMKEYCTSTAFKEIIAVETENKDVYKHALASGAWDANLLERLASALPEALKNSLLSRAYKSEILVQFVSFKERFSLIRSLREDNSKAVRYLFDLGFDYKDAPTGTIRLDAVQRVREVREAYYARHGTTIVNHTTPTPFSMLARQHYEESSCVTVSYTRPESKCQDDGMAAQYANFYDGRSVAGTGSSTKSSGMDVRDSETYKSLNPVGKCVAIGAAICGLVQARGDTEAADTLWALICVMWGGEPGGTVPNLGIQYKPTASTKRLGMRIAHTNHQILMFPNTAKSIQVDTSRLARYMDSFSLNIDLMSVITAGRIIGLFEYAARSEKPPTMHFAITADSLVITDPILYEVTDQEEVLLAIDSAVPKEKLFESFQHNLRSVVIEPVADEDEGLICDRTAFRGRYTDSAEMCIRAGALFDNRLGIITARSNQRDRKNTEDECAAKYSTRARLVYARYRSKHGGSKAALYTLLTLMSNELPAICPDRIVMARWRDMADEVDSQLPAAKALVGRAFVAIRRISDGISLEVVQELCCNRPMGCSNYIASGGAACYEYREMAVSVLVNAVYGRYCSEDLYTATAHMGSSAIKRSWLFASRRCRLLSRDPGDARYLMHKLYETMANRVHASRTFRDLIVSLSTAIEAALEASLAVKGALRYADRSDLYPKIEAIELVRGNDQEILREWLKIVMSRSGLMESYSQLWNTVRGICDDLCGLSAALNPVQQVAEADLVCRGVIMEGIEEYEGVLAMDIAEPKASNWEKNAALWYMTGDMAAARRVYTSKIIEPIDYDLALECEDIREICNEILENSSEAADAGDEA